MSGGDFYGIPTTQDAPCPCGCGGELHIPTSALIEQRDVELDHAIAAERNRIADWLDDYATNAKHRANSAKANHSPGIATTWETRARDAHNHAQDIRHGLHWRARG